VSSQFRGPEPCTEKLKQNGRARINAAGDALIRPWPLPDPPTPARDRRSPVHVLEHGGERVRRERAREQYLETLSRRLSQCTGMPIARAREHVEAVSDQCSQAAGIVGPLKKVPY